MFEGNEDCGIREEGLHGSGREEVLKLPQVAQPIRIQPAEYTFSFGSEARRRRKKLLLFIYSIFLEFNFIFLFLFYCYVPRVRLVVHWLPSTYGVL
jgi:hypothetical protein